MRQDGRVWVDMDLSGFNTEMTAEEFIDAVETVMKAIKAVPEKYRDTIQIRLSGYDDWTFSVQGSYIRDKTPEELEQERRESEFESQSKERQERLMLERLKAKYGE